MADVPAPPGEQLDRQALERVLARAAELQARATDAPEMLSEAELLSLGAEVGFTADHMRLALAEERTRSLAPVDGGWIARLLGGATVSATRTVPGTPAEVLERLDAWFAREESLTVQRRSPARLVWEPRQDFFGSMQRALKLGGRGYALGRAGEVAATAQALDGARTHLRLDANLVRLRRQRVVGGTAGALGTGAAMSGVLVVVGILFPFWLVPAVASSVGAWAIARSFRAPVARAQVMLEHYLDRLEHGEAKRPPSLLDLLPSGRPPR